MKTLLAIAVIAASIATVPASAVTYDAFASFNGTTNPSGAFSYGAFDGTTFTPFTTFSDCQTGLRCLLSDSEPALGIYQNVTGAAFTAFGTVNVPANTLFFHPGPSSQAYVMFTAPTSALYNTSLFFKLLSNGTITGTTIGSGFIVGGTPIPAGTETLTAGFPEVGIGGPLFINAGDSIYLTVGNDGDFRFDSTQFVVSLTAVPEPASWAMLIAGFGLPGAALRRRRAVAITA